MENDYWEQQCSMLSDNSELHAHYDQLHFNDISIELDLDFGIIADKCRFIVKSEGGEWFIFRTVSELLSLDITLHKCVYTRDHSNLPELSYSCISTKTRALKLDAEHLVSHYMTQLNNCISNNINGFTCVKVLEFFEVNNKGHHTIKGISPMAINGELLENHKRLSICNFGDNRSSKKKRVKVFGLDLTQHLRKHNEQIPCILQDCVTYLENNIVSGIYRISSVTSQVNNLKNTYDNRKNSEFDFEKVSKDVHSVACLLKLYFRSLPVKLFYLLSDYNIRRSESTDDQIDELRSLLSTLPLSHYKTAEYLINHLSFIAEKSHITNMDAANLALVWSPNLFGITTAKDQINNMNSQNALVEALIRWNTVVFQRVPTRSHSILKSQSNFDFNNYNSVHDNNYSEIPNSLSVNDYTRVRSEEPPGRSFMSQFKRNLKVIGSNMKLSFRNLVNLSHRSSKPFLNSGTSEYNIAMSKQRDMSTLSLNVNMFPHSGDPIYQSSLSSRSGGESGCTTTSSAFQMAPKAELDSFSTESLPFETSRYDNLDGKRVI